jgi:hypothetical protein
MAARTADQILSDWESATALSDSTADTQKGPLFSWVGQPISQVLAPTETNVDQLSQIYSVNFAQAAAVDSTSTQPLNLAQAFLDNWGETAGLGQPSTTYVYFMSFSRPGPTTIISISQGTIVSNQDQSLQYVTTQSAQINGAFADTYFNASRRTYEIAVPVQAVQNGPTYDLSAGLINTLVSQVPGIDAVESRQDATGGVAAEGVTEQISRVQQKMLGLAVNTPNGAYTRVTDYNPTAITDVKVILSTDRQLFRRITYLPGFDYYIVGTLNASINETYTSAIGGETMILIQHVPAVSINSVTINDVAITSYSLQPDTSIATGYSAIAQDYLVLSAPLIAGDVVVLNVTYNSLPAGIQTNVFGITTLRNTDELARLFRQVPLNISVTGKALSGYDATAVQSSTLSQIQAFIQNNGKWTSQLLPNTLLQTLQVSVPGLSNPSITVFQRSTGATATVQPVVIQENELAAYSSSNTIVTITST